MHACQGPYYIHELPSMACFYPFSLLLLLVVVLLSLPSSHAAAATHHRARPPIKVQGFVLCDSCRENRLSNFSLPIPGATITLTCKSTLKHHSTSTSSDKYGAFSFDLPFSKPRLLRRCKVELTSSPFEACIKRTSYSWKVLSPLLRLKSQEKGHLAYFSGWLSYQPNFLPSFCTLSKEVLTKNGHNVAHSKDKTLLPQGFSFPNFFPPFPGTSTPSFPFNFFPPNFFPPMPTIPGTTTPTSPFYFPPIPGFPPFPEFSPFPNFPGFPNFPNFPFPFPFPSPFPFPFSSPSPSPGLPNSFPPFPPFPMIEIPPNPISPSTPTSPFSTATNPFMSPPLQLPPNPISPSTPTSPFNTPTNPFSTPSLQLPPLPPPWTSPPFLNP